MACLDTTLLIDLASRKSQRKELAAKKIADLVTKGQGLATTRFNLAELYVGLSQSKHPEEDEKAIHALLSEFEILEFDDAAARVFGFVTSLLQRIGKPAGDMDVLIAATAMVHGHILVTRNPKHFSYIPHLIVEDY
jgi:tRNA(fMet)-specific endonuclease VapC